MRVTTDPDLHLIVDGARIAPSMVAASAHVFRLELPVGEVRLCSRRVRPSEISTSTDTRTLGFAISGLRLQQGRWTFDIDLAEPELRDGFHAFEPEGWRWTNGDAALPRATFATVHGAFLFIVFGWAAPEYRLPDHRRGDDEQMFLEFEGLGEDSEFGFAQRYHGAEPMGLLRWADIDFATLHACMADRFSALGNPDTTELVWSDDYSEYRLVDRGAFSARTWVTARSQGAAEEAKIKRYGCMQLRLLRRKLVADIEQARKIFVFKSSGPGVGRSQHRRLHAALRGIGPARLLCVQLAGPGDPVGEVADHGDGLFVGYVARFGSSNESFEQWRSLCLQTKALMAYEPIRAAAD